MNEDDESGSLADQAAAWVPPWQRPHAPTPASHNVESGSRVPTSGEGAEDEDDDDWQQPETDSLTVGGAARPGDDDDDEQRPETDFAAVGVATGPGDDDDDDWQQPETDFAAVSVAAGPGDDDDDEQRPETDFAAVGVVAGPGDDDDDDWQQPETDSLSGPAVVRPGDDDDAPRLETDSLTIAAGAADDGWQRPEEDSPALTVAIGPGDDEDDWQQPETDVHAPDDDDSDSRRPANLSAALEAILLVVDEPVASDVLAEVLDVGIDEANAALETLSAQYTADERGFDLRRAAGGWRLYTRGAYSSYVERFVLDGQSVRLTQAALETLAVIAYQQPVTRSRMSAIRGVNCDGVVRTLANRGLIEECGASPDSGAFLYRTTPLFLEKLGLDSLDELPPLAPFLPDDVNGFIDA